MIFYKLDHVIEAIKKDELSGEQKILREYVGVTFSRPEAEVLWRKILDHKWYVSERLKRDIGLRVAAVDYVENFYEPAGNRQNHLRPVQSSLSPTVFVA